MTEATHKSQRIAVRRFFGIPVLMVQRSYPIAPGTWGWGRWRFATPSDELHVNKDLMRYWIDG